MKILTGEKNIILRQKSKLVEHLTKEIRDLIIQMKKIMEDNNGVGLAAPQINVSQRIIICEVDNKFYTFINPEIIKSSKETLSIEEGCLSLPNTYGEVERPEKIIFKAIDSDGKKIKLKVFGLLARIVQHEIDHLDGILFIDKAKNVVKDTVQKRISI
ncbi:MAG: peptide deformylase [Candidatus Paceibacterota bacterium]|jgi:peptide deformylase